MPGYVILIAVATEYIRKFGTSDEAKFIEGTLDPDLLAVGSKAKTHYSESTSDKTDLKEFLKSNKVNSSYLEGYFLHLIADFLFYNKYFLNCDSRIYNDYDILNEELIIKYDLKVPRSVKDVVKFKNGELEILEKNKLDDFIKEVSNKNLNEWKKIIEEGNEWDIS